MAAQAQMFDSARYRKLLAKVEPRVIQTDEEYDRLDAHLGALIDKEHRGPEEEALCELLGRLIMDYEKRAIPPLPKLSPLEMLKAIMEAGGLKAKDLVPLLGPSGRVSETLAGKRQISKAQARRLAEHFHMKIEAFI